MKLLIPAVVICCLLIPLTPLAQVCTPQLTGLVNLWPGDGNANDLLGAAPGTPQAGATFAPGLFQDAFSFDGINDYIDLPDTRRVTGQSQVTVHAWIRPVPGPGARHIYFEGAVGNTVFSVVVLADGRVASGVRSDATPGGFEEFNPSNITSITPIPDGQWTFVAVTVNLASKSYKMYIDGAEAPSTIVDNTQNTTFISSPNNVHIGIASNFPVLGTSSPFAGLIDELAIYHRVLSAQEIADIYNAGNECRFGDLCEPPLPGLVNLWLGDGNADDLLGAAPGTPQAGATFAPGLFQDAFSFDGIDDYIDLPATRRVSGQSEVTIHAWIRPGPGKSSIYFEGAGGNTVFSLARIADGRMILGVRSDATPGGFEEFNPSNITSITPIPDGQWTFVAATVSLVSKSYKMYINGVEAPSTIVDNTQNTTFISSPNNVHIGIASFFPNAGFSSPFPGLIDELAIYHRVLSAQEIADIYNAGNECGFGDLAGRVVADCPLANTNLLGVVVDAYEVDTGNLVGSDATDVDGLYEIPDLPVGGYTVAVVTPLGYTASTPEIGATVTAGVTTTADFSLNCADLVGSARDSGFWKHQIGVATGGRGKAQIDARTLCDYLELIVGHFNSNSINQVIVYDPPALDDCTDSLLVAKDLLNLKGNVGMKARARQHLMALLFNVASGGLRLREIVSVDDATVSQAITRCDNIIDDTAGDYELAKNIAEYVNNGTEVPAGWIPLGTVDIAYSPPAPKSPGAASFSLTRIYPNPFNPTTTIAYSIAKTGVITLRIYDVNGALVRTLVNGPQTATEHVVTWEGKDARGVPTASGIYFVRLESGGQVQTRKIVLLK